MCKAERLVGKGRPSAAAHGQIVCFLSTHPLVLPELQRYLTALRYKTIGRQLKITPGTDVHRLPLPVALAYVVDGHSLGPATEGLVAGIRYRHRKHHVIVLVEEMKKLDCFPLLRLGVKGLITYAEVPKQLAQAVRLIAGGGIWVPRDVMSHYLEMGQKGHNGRLPVTGTKGLSRREKDVLDLLLKNFANKEIASSLHISESTVKFHVSNIISRFGVQRRGDLILQSLQESSTIQ